jgi:hypothetical protein
VLATATFSNVSVGAQQPTPPPPPPATTGSAILTWTPPTHYTDGSPLTGLVGFKLYWGTTSGVYSRQLAINNPLTRTWTLNDLPAGRWFFAVSALDVSGSESAKSNEASKLIQ